MVQSAIQFQSIAMNQEKLLEFPSISVLMLQKEIQELSMDIITEETTQLKNLFYIQSFLQIHRLGK